MKWKISVWLTWPAEITHLQLAVGHLLKGQICLNSSNSRKIKESTATF